jgi:DNA-binding transcriptional LysR family regulator
LRIQVKSFEAVCRMIESGLGIGVLPKGAADNFVGSMNLKLVRLEDTWAERRMLVCVQTLDRLSLLARRLVEHLAGINREVA